MASEHPARTIGVLRETYPGERRVAIVPAAVPELAKGGFEVVVEPGAGVAAGFIDEAYRQKGAVLATSRDEALSADVLIQVRVSGAWTDAGLEDVHPGQVLVGMARPLNAPEAIKSIAGRDVALFALELLPRITRAQSMDVLSSQATVSGYKAVLVGAAALPKMFPLMTTAAGTIAPARVLVIGAGVAGLSAIATARRLGALVEAYDVRPAVKEEVESLGARFVELSLQPGDAEDASGYAKALGEAFYRRQQELLARVVAGADLVVTTAVIPGKAAPRLVTADMVRSMAPGSIVVDLAAEQGGNCELSRPDEEVIEGGVRIFGPTNLPATVPRDASQMYAKNAASFLLHVVQDGRLALDPEDRITQETLVCIDGEIVGAKVRLALGLPEPSVPQPTEPGLTAEGGGSA